MAALQKTDEERDSLEQLQYAVRQELKSMIDGLSEFDLHAVKRYIQFIRYLDDPVAVSLAEAPLDDEEVTEEDIAAFTETEEDFRTGKAVPLEEVMREFGL